MLWGLPFLQQLVREGAEQVREQYKAEVVIDRLTAEGSFPSSDPCSICFEEFREGQLMR